MTVRDCTTVGDLSADTVLVITSVHKAIVCGFYNFLCSWSKTLTNSLRMESDKMYFQIFNKYSLESLPIQSTSKSYITHMGVVYT